MARKSLAPKSLNTCADERGQISVFVTSVDWSTLVVVDIIISVVGVGEATNNEDEGDNNVVGVDASVGDNTLLVEDTVVVTVSLLPVFGAIIFFNKFNLSLESIKIFLETLEIILFSAAAISAE